ncbi:TPA: class I SAM-dependent methyltransferase [Thermoplasmata archaeon]|nr:class I SAM-dependent methyltransferase [Thermoplasmata archaeon]
MPTLSFDRIADRYDETRAFPPGVAERVAEVLAELSSSGDTILDIGVGTGRLAVPAHRRGLDVTGVDVSRGMIGKAREKGFDQLILADALALPFKDGAFALSISVHLTHLIGDWRRALTEIARVTKGQYATVAADRTGCELEELQRAYEEACASQGFEVKHPGLRERELMELVSPSKVVSLANRDEQVPAREALDRYRTRTYSDLWEVPEDIHARSMERLEEEYGRRSHLRHRERISLVVWDSADVRKFVQRLGAL